MISALEETLDDTPINAAANTGSHSVSSVLRFASASSAMPDADPVEESLRFSALVAKTGLIIDLSNLSTMFKLITVQDNSLQQAILKSPQTLESIFDNLIARPALPSTPSGRNTSQAAPLSFFLKPRNTMEAARWLDRLHNGQAGGEIAVEFTGAEQPDDEREEILICAAAVEADGVTEVTAVFSDRMVREDYETKIQEARFASKIAERARLDFMANMSHELRTPLNAVIGFSEALRSEVYGDINDDQQEAIDFIHYSGEHLLSLVGDILDLSKLDVGKVELREASIDLANIVQNCTALVRPRAVEGKVNLQCHLPETRVMLRAEERMIKQIALNLLSNAIKFTESGGKVDISVEYRPDGDLCLVVEDTGIGMNKADIPKALSRFGQIDSALDRRFEGAGLGLPLILAHAELHGADVNLESEPGCGTRVSVTFPSSRVIGK